VHSAITAACVLASITLQVPTLESGAGMNDRVQDGYPKWTQLEQARGLTVSVEDVTGSRIVGTLLRLEGESLVLRVKATEQRIDRDVIRRITAKRKDSVKNGYLTGALVGAGMAAMSSCNSHGRKCGARGRAAFVAFGAGLWALIGGAIDNSIDKRVTLYDARPK
jgi:hypothetical protein